MIRSASVLLALALAAPAAAFAPTEVPLGSGAFKLVHPREGTAQAALRAGEPWQRLLAEAPDWQARFDENTGTPLRMWGSPVDIGPARSAAEVEAGLLDFVDRHPDLLGTDPTELFLRSATYTADTDTWYVDFDVVRDGLPLFNGGLTARVRHGRLVMLGAETWPQLSPSAPRRLARAAAVGIAVSQGPVPKAMHVEEAADLGATAVQTADGVAMRPVWRVFTRTELPVGRWESLVDAETGELLAFRNDVRFVTGHLTAEHDERTVSPNRIVSALPFARITLPDSSFVQADATGAFEIDGETGTIGLRGGGVRVHNDVGADATWPVDGDTLVTGGGDERVLAQIDTYLFLHQIQAWGARVAPGVVTSIAGHVNIDETCNAYFDGDVNFFRAGRGCNNTGRIADIVYHEWGHGLHYESLLSGTFDGSLSEGAADTVSFLNTGDPIIAPFFETDGDYIRNVAPDRVYPDDYSSNEDRVHRNGLIFGGAMWDLLGILKAEHGDDDGQAITEQIFTRLLRGGPDIATSYEEAVFADDDDGDLANGTPHLCAIVEAFGMHGLGPLGSDSPFTAYHEPLPGVDPLAPRAVSVDFSQEAAECFTAVPVSANVHFRVNGGEWQQAPLTLGAGDASGAIPAQRQGDLVEYWIAIADSEGGVSMSPHGGVIHPFSYFVGDIVPVYCNDFEHDNGSFTHELVSGEATEGADDWQWGYPRGRAGDPNGAFSGNKVWGNDLGGSDYNGAYQNGKHNRLTSPEIDLRHYSGSFLHYMRWLTVEDGVFDQARVLVGGEVVWSNWRSTQSQGDQHTEDRQWMPHAVDLGDAAGPIRISFDLKSDQGLSMGGWNIDDLCVFAPATADNRLGISDFTATGDGDRAIVLSWTNPLHGPVTELVVVRSKRGFPEGPDDGEEVFHLANPVPGEPATFTDGDVGKSRSWYYAVYASDGQDWLSWTVPGWNADAARADGGEIRDGCGGCATPGALPFAWPLLLAALVRRRR